MYMASPNDDGPKTAPPLDHDATPEMSMAQRPLAVEDQATCITGYPPVIGYPTPHEHASNYNYLYAYPYYAPSAPPMHHFPEPGHPASQPLDGSDRSLKWRRILLETSLAAILIFLIVAIVLHLLLLPGVPILQVRYFSVSNFTISNSTLSAAWEADVSVKNPSRRMSVELYGIESAILYNGTQVSLSTEEPTLSLAEKASGAIHVDMCSKEQDPDTVGAIRNDLQTSRSVSFYLKLAMSAKFKHWWWSRDGGDGTFFCGELKVVLEGDNGLASAADNDKPINCTLYT